MIRAFVALDVDAATIAEATRLVASLQSGALAGVRASWVQSTRMHVTVRFLGDVEEQVAGRIGAGMRRLGAGVTERLSLRARTLGAFPSARRAHVLTMPLEVAQAGRNLAEELEAVTVRAGLAPERRPWVPHLTLARFRQPADVQDVVRTPGLALEGWATGLTLYRSTLGSGGPTYDALARAELPG